MHRQTTFAAALGLLLLVSALLTLAGCEAAAPEEEEAEAPMHYSAVPVKVGVAERTTLRPTLDLVGTLLALPEATALICPQVSGTVMKVAVVEGQAVNAGDEVVLLDNRAAEADVAKAVAAVDEKAAVLERLKRGSLPQEIEVAKQDVQKFKVTADALRSKVAALSALREKNELSVVQFETARSALESAEAEHAAAQAKLALLEAGTPREQIAEAQAQLAEAQANLAAAQLAVRFCHLASPIDGIVTQLTVRRGMSVDPTTCLATIVNLATVFAQFRVPSVYMAQVRPGAAVEVSLVSLPGETFHGTVTRLSGQADAATGDVGAFVTLANEGGLLKPGLGCRLSVALPPIPDALVIPVAAVADRSGTPVVTLVKDNKAREIEVKLGVQVGPQVQVLEGLAPGDTVATENGYGLPDDCPVRIESAVPAGAPSAAP